MAWGMFLAVPCPVKVWDEKLRDNMLSMLPFIGVLIGIMYIVLIMLVRNISQALRAAVLAVYPWAITGFIHIDGYMDVCDAVFSRRDTDEKIRILKDPACGAFAVIAAVILCMFQFSACFDADIAGISYISLVCVFCASRASASIAVMTLKPISKSQYNGMVHNKSSLVIPGIMLILSVILPILLSGSMAAVMTAIVYALCALIGYRQFKGFNGDISGFSLCVSEFAGILMVMR